MSIKPTKQSIHSEEVKKKILTCSQELFASYGYENTSMKDIASAAGVTTGSIYHHFENKEDILRGILLSRDYFSDDLLKKYQTTETPKEDLHDFICGLMVDQVLSDGIEFTRFRIMRIFKFRQGKGKRLDQCVSILVNKCIDKGLFTDELSADEITDFITSVYRGAAYQYSVSEPPVDFRELVEKRYNIAMRAIEK